MAVLLKKFALLLLPFLLVAAYAEVRLGRMENVYLRKAQGIVRHAATTQVLILGSSHALYGIDPDLFRLRTFNFANVSQSYYYDYQIFSRYVKSLTQLRAVIVPVSSFSFGYSLAHTPEEWRRHFYRRYFDLAPEGSDGAAPGLLDAKRYSLIALYGVEESVKLLRRNFRSDLGNLAANGWQRYPAGNTRNLSPARVRERVAFHEGLQVPGQAAVNLGYLRALSGEVRGAGAALLLVTLPVDRSYAAACDPAMIRDMEERAAAFCAAEGCAYLDYFNDPRFDSADFFDSDHLNQSGAVKFSRILNGDLMGKLAIEPGRGGAE